MSVVRVANPDLLKTLATEEDEFPPPITEPVDWDSQVPLPLGVLELMIKRGMTTQSSDRYNPAIPSPFSSSVLTRVRNEQFRMRTLTEFRSKEKRPLTISKTTIRTKHKFFDSGDRLFEPSNQTAKPTLLRRPPEIDYTEIPKLAKLDTSTIDHDLQLYDRRRCSRIGKIFDRKYSRQWKRQY